MINNDNNNNPLHETDISALGKATLELARAMYGSEKSLMQEDISVIFRERYNLDLTLTACSLEAQKALTKIKTPDIQVEILQAHAKRLNAQGQDLLKRLSDRLRSRLAPVPK
jgi:hypothetical protein